MGAEWLLPLLPTVRDRDVSDLSGPHFRLLTPAPRFLCFRANEGGGFTLVLGYSRVRRAWGGRKVKGRSAAGMRHRAQG